MFVPETYGLALLLMILCMICWGSWANTFKLAGKVRFELFYWDYALGVFMMAVILALTLGSWHGGDDAFFNNLTQATGPRIALAMAAGTIFNLANILLVGAIAIAGMTIAFPVAIGAALVIGTVLTYIVDRTGNPAMLFAGVGLAVVAILDNQYEDAIGHCGLVQRSFGDQRYCLQVMAVASMLDEDYEGAAGYFNHMNEVWPEADYGRLGLAQIHLVRGEMEPANALLNDVFERRSTVPEPDWRDHWVVAAVLAMRGEKQAAVAELERTLESDRIYFAWDAFEPAFSNLHDDERFAHYLAASRQNGDTSGH